MARKSSSTIVQEELYPPSAPPAREELDDARLVDLDFDEESPFLRAQKRVSARRSSLPKKTAHRLLWVVAGFCCLGATAFACGVFYRYGERSWRFRVDSSDNIEINGMQNVTKAQIMEVMGADIGRNIFFIPLAQQKAQLEQLPWVESASVMRFVPNRLQVEIKERTPVAFARVGPRIFLVDAGGTLMDLPPKRKYSFPVILGMNQGEPLSTREPRMKVYGDLVGDLNSTGAHYSQDLSEVDLSDLDDVKVRVNDPAGDVLVHLGGSDYLHRYKVYVTHVQEWRQQFQKLESVDLRYDNQIIVNPDLPPATKQLAARPLNAKAALAAGVKQAALVTSAPLSKVLPKPAFELPESELTPKAAAPQQTALRPQVPTKPQAAAKSQIAPKIHALAVKPQLAESPSKLKKTVTHSTRHKNVKSALKKSAAVHASQPSQISNSQKSTQSSSRSSSTPTVKAMPKPSPAIAKQSGSSD